MTILSAFRRSIPLLPVLAIGGVAGLPADASPAAAGRPSIHVKPRIRYTEVPLTFVVANAKPFGLWKLEMHNPAPRSRSDDEIKLGTHRANKQGVIRFTQKALGVRGAHFTGKAYETWLVNVFPAHPIGNEPGPFQTVFRTYRGCGCGGR